MKIDDKLRKAAAKSGMSQYRLTKLTGIRQSSLSRFLKGKSLAPHNQARLAKVLGYELVPARLRKVKP